MAAEFKRVVTDENVPNVTSHVLLQEILSFVVIAEEKVHQFVIAWKRVENVLIKSILDVRRTAFSVRLVKMACNILAEV